MTNPGTAIFSMQTAVFELLATDTTLRNAGAPVFDGTADPDTPYPYVLIDSWTEAPDNRLTGFGRQLTCMVHVYSNYEGVREAATLTGAVLKLLEEQPITVIGWSVCKVTLDLTQSLKESNEVRHAFSRFRFKVTPK